MIVIKKNKFLDNLITIKRSRRKSLLLKQSIQILRRIIFLNKITQTSPIDKMMINNWLWRFVNRLTRLWLLLQSLKLAIDSRHRKIIAIKNSWSFLIKPKKILFLREVKLLKRKIKQNHFILKTLTKMRDKSPHQWRTR